MSSNKISLFDKLMTMVSQYQFQDGEVIKEIIKYNSNGRYYISNYGNVITLCNNVWRLKKPEIDKDGYLFVCLWYKGKRIHKGIHQLVAESFLVNSAPQEKTIIHHIDFNPLNNHATNLMYVSPKEHRAIHDKHNLEIAEKRIKVNADRENN